MEDYSGQNGTASNTISQELSNSSAEMNGKYLTFWTDSQLFGIAISSVQQIVGVQKITSIPNFPDYFKGIINLRGSIIPVIDVRLRFNKPETVYNERTCIIVINIQQQLFGFIVDAVDEVTRIDEENISEPPDASTEDACAYLKGIAKLENRVVLLLDAGYMIRGSKISA
ncbi:MAG TPA: chemotaxis protein CheW [Caproiciproducens sp.]|jgi:Chemotaxis signal transduction protein|nr:chemotaxis protein CheW [Caproiciproducens sp.]